MNGFSSIRGLACLTCGRVYPLGPMLGGCPDCQASGRLAILNPVYTYGEEEARALSGVGAGRLWDYHKLLPVPNQASVITMGEGETPLVPLPSVARETGAQEVWAKY